MPAVVCVCVTVCVFVYENCKIATAVPVRLENAARAKKPLGAKRENSSSSSTITTIFNGYASIV